ncbi:alpha/beta fold hydrolase [uncultured Psychroserpens sp.]|uniref:alpha/beta hydrolase family protein n=1 Tax=uncultured Psychroserpens sp. TaxID=255436 RepID=UPI002610B6DA|nr:alpha/beta fold hydrolase [uncultured Psychroserpens sp.]
MKHLLTFFIVAFFWNSSFSQEFQFTKKETSFKNGDITLYADVYTPNNPKKEKIGIAIIQGAGKSDRSNVWSFLNAEFLAENGYYVLLPDKRGCGKSEGDWKQTSFFELADDAAISAAHLKKLMGLEKVGLMGLSQGGKIAPMAASKIKSDINFVIDIVGSAKPISEGIIYEMTQTAMEDGLNPEEIKEMLGLHVLLDEYIFSEERNFKPLKQKLEELKKSTWSKFAAEYPNTSDSWVWDFAKNNYAIDIMDYWSVLKQDVFFAFGANDHNVATYDNVYYIQKGLYAAKKTNYEMHVYPTGHGLYQSGTTFHIDFRKDLLNWLDKR